MPTPAQKHLGVAETYPPSSKRCVQTESPCLLSKEGGRFFTDRVPDLERVMNLSEAKRGVVLLPRRWVVERSFGWVSRFRQLARDYER